MPKSLLDSDTVSYLMRGQPQVTARAEVYKTEYGIFTIAAITRYEVLKGLMAINATAKLRAFERFCRQNEVLPLTEEVIVRAAGIYSDLHRRGALINDPDIFIAATALEHDLVMVTNNERHFSRIAGLQVENWLK